MKEENKIWVGKDGIIHVEIIEMVNEKEILELLEEAKEITKMAPPSPRILIVNLVTSSVLRSYRIRKQVGEKIKEMVFEKGAICEENVFSRKAAIFIMAASGIKNVEVFEKKQEALEWLKEP